MENFVSTPSTSDVDVLIEQFKIEIAKDLPIDPDARRITITNTFKPKETKSNHGIDKQISDLEDLIKKLQDEINEMSKNTDKNMHVEYTRNDEDSYSVHKNLSNGTIILNNDTDDSESGKLNIKNDHTNVFDKDQFTHVYPLVIQDVILPMNKSFTRTSKSECDKRISFTQDVIQVWNDVPDSKADDNLDGLIPELQAEISEKMDTVKDVNIEEKDSSLKKDD